MANPGGKRTNRNTKTVLVLGGMTLAMLGLAYAAVPLYKIFCQVTGYGGTPKISQVAADEVLNRTMKVRFDANVDRKLRWKFKPNQLSQVSHIGESKMATFQATNTTDHPITGQATFNITPQKAASYFVKLDCFCFTEQTLQPGQTVEMPVLYYVDPDIAKDKHMGDVQTMTLSYTFYEKAGANAPGGAGKPERQAAR